MCESFGQLIALLKDVLRQVVHGIGGAHAPNIDHSLCEHGDDSFHKELSHVEFLALLQLTTVLL